MNRLFAHSTAVFLLSVLGPASAEVVLDGSMGRAGAVAQNGNDYAVTHDLGQIRGANLFHSFSQFNIRSGESATFSGPGGLANVLSRVTGGNASNIDGLLRSTVPGANFWFVNPSGVFFGPGASIDVPGSFYAGTANYIGFADGSRFDATNPATTTLTAAAPTAFGFLGVEPAPLQVTSSDLSVSEGSELALVGGDVRVGGGAALNAPEGSVRLEGAGSAGEVSPSDQVIAIGDVSGGSRVAISDSEIAGQTLVIRGGSIETLGETKLDARTNSPDHGLRVDLLAKSDIDLGGSTRLRANGASGGEAHIESETGSTSLHGSVEAIGVSGLGGRVELLGVNVGLLGSALVDVSGDMGGGVALIGGDYQGLGATRPAQSTFVARDAVIRGDAWTQGDGGRVIVWGDEFAGFDGRISARGGQTMGDGGFTEISSRTELSFSGSVDLQAANGVVGALLLDPENIQVVAESRTTDGVSMIRASRIEAVLETASLELKAEKNLGISAPVDAANRKGDLALIGENILIDSTINVPDDGLRVTGETVTLSPNGRVITENGGRVDFVDIATLEFQSDGTFSGPAAEIVTKAAEQQNGGDVNLEGIDTLSMANYTELRSENTGAGRGGQIRLANIGGLDLGFVKIGSENHGSGRGGGIHFIDLSTAATFSASVGSVNHGSGDGGNVTFASMEALEVRNVESDNTGAGRGGSIEFDGIGELRVDRVSSTGSFSSELGSSGGIGFSTIGSLILEDAVVASDGRAGKAGPITIGGDGDKGIGTLFIVGNDPFLPSLSLVRAAGKGALIDVSNVGRVSLSLGGDVNPEGVPPLAAIRQTGEGGEAIRFRDIGTLDLEHGEISAADAAIEFSRVGRLNVVGSEFQASFSGVGDIVGTNGIIEAKAGDVILSNVDVLEVHSGLISTKTDSDRDAGRIDFTGNESLTSRVLIDGVVSSTTTAGGDAGTVRFERVGELTVTDIGEISSRTKAPGDESLAGNAGAVEFDNIVELLNQGRISTSTAFGKGRGGTNTFSEIGTLRVSGALGQINSRTFAGGLGGSILIGASTLEVSEGGQISTATLGSGEGGSVMVGSPDLGRAESVVVRGGGRIAATTSGTGGGGSISIYAKQTTLDGEGAPGFTGIDAQTSGQAGQGGSIEILGSDALTLRDNARISTSSRGTGDGGDIQIDARQISIRGEGSSISSDSLGLADLDFNLDQMLIEQSLASQVDVFLESPSGTRVNLLSSLGDTDFPPSVSTYEDLRLDDRAPEPVSDAPGDFDGTFRPKEPLSVFIGEPLDGVWTLEITKLSNAGNVERVDPPNVWSLGFDGRVETSTDVPDDVCCENGRFTRTSELDVSAGGTAVAGSAQFDGSIGTGGNITVNADSMSLFDGAGVSATTSTKGDAGSVTIKANSLSLNAVDDGAPRLPGAISSSTTGSGNAGRVNVTLPRIHGTEATANEDFGRLTIRDGSTVESATFSEGHAGGVVVTADAIRIDAADSTDCCTGISVSSQPEGGPVDNPGDGGFIEIDVAGEIELFGNSDLSRDTARIGAIAFDSEGRSGQAGSVTVKAGVLTIDHGSISSATEGDGDASTVSIQVAGPPPASQRPDLDYGVLTIRNGGQVESASDGTGSAGDVLIAADSVVLVGEIMSFGQGAVTSEISTSSTLSGGGGFIDIQATESILQSGGLISSTVKDFYPAIDDQSPLWSGVSDPSDTEPGRIDLSAPEIRLIGAAIEANTEGTRRAGIVTLGANALHVSEESNITSTSSAAAKGGAGDIRIVGASGDEDSQARVVTLNESQLLTRANGEGAGGFIEIDASESISQRGGTISSAVRDRGVQPNILGEVSLRAPTINIVGGQVEATTTGNREAGSVALAADHLHLSGKSKVTSSSVGTASGPAGAVFIEGRDGENSRAESVSLGDGEILTVAEAVGAGGRIQIGVSSFTAAPGGRVSSTVNNVPLGSEPDDGLGNITFRADTMRLDGARIEAQTQGSRDGGGIFIAATDIDLRQGAEITAGSTGTGRAGDVFIVASESFDSRNSKVTTESTRADGGDIDFQVKTLFQLEDASVTTSVGGGEGSGGNITIDPKFVVLRSGRIEANAFEGSGGKIKIVADNFFATPDSVVQASSQLGIDGDIEIDAAGADVVGGLAQLPANFQDPGRLLLTPCGQRVGTAGSRIEVSPLAGLPRSPEEYFFSATGPTQYPFGEDSPTGEEAAAVGVSGNVYLLAMSPCAQRHRIH